MYAYKARVALPVHLFPNIDRKWQKIYSSKAKSYNVRNFLPPRGTVYGKMINFGTTLCASKSTECHVKNGSWCTYRTFKQHDFCVIIQICVHATGTYFRYIGDRRVPVRATGYRLYIDYTYTAVYIY